MLANDSTKETPAQLMLGRQLYSRLDLLSQATAPASAPELPVTKYSKGDAVIVRDYRHPAKKWVIGRVDKVCGRTVALVKTEEGTWKRHFDQIRRRAESKSDTSAPDNAEPDQIAMAMAFGQDQAEPSAANDDDDDTTSSTFETAQSSSSSSSEDEAPPVPNVVTESDLEVRRSTRSTRGKLPNRFCSQ